MMCKMAEILDDGGVLHKYSAILQKGSEAFERLLWNGASGQGAEPSPSRWALRCAVLVGASLCLAPWDAGCASNP